MVDKRLMKQLEACIKINFHFSCQIIPSEVKISQRSEPQEVSLDKPRPQIKTLADLGPEFFHFYEILNLGPHTIGNMETQITWPLRVSVVKGVKNILAVTYTH